MNIRLFRTSAEMGESAAQEAAAVLRETIARQGHARIIAATGASQLPLVERLRSMPGIDWGRVEMFHLDEYIGLPITHPASFRKFLLERLIQPTGIKRYHFLDGDGDAAAVCRRVGHELRSGPIHLALVGFGENGHLAFNDPPADFATEEPCIVVNLDEACRRQQVGEGWFETLDEVPKQALTMSVRQILKAQKILCTVPDQRKAKATKACLEGDISPHAPSSILRNHPDVVFFFDVHSASLLSRETLAKAQRHL
jgi:glucosamine-6-phosphate deaminase